MACILIIDDDHALRATLRMVLERAGHRVREVSDGFQAIRSLRDQPAELVLCDLFMPEKDGLETIRELRTDHAGIKIIAMSGGCPGTATDFLPFAEKFGAARILHKPFDVKQLLGAVRDVLQLACVQG
jgi:DNA-binding response OmpR family regulator